MNVGRVPRSGHAVFTGPPVSAGIVCASAGSAPRHPQIGVDIYNFLNSDAITSCNATYTPDTPATAANENTWLQPMGLVSPRFIRLQVQFNF